MGIRYYAPGEHPTGWVGFRVTRGFGQNYRQAYFNTVLAKAQSDSDPYFRYQRLQAEYKEAEWVAESLEYQYTQFVTTSNPTAKPWRGLGVHGITAMFARYYGGTHQPCFSVNRPGKPQKRFMFKFMPYSEAWAQAVNLWADENNIMPEDRMRVLNNPPDPEHFKHLRRQMNDHEGFDISVEALGPVFQERREQIAQKKLQQRSQDLRLSDVAPTRDEAEAEILAWFESERQQA